MGGKVVAKRLYDASVVLYTLHNLWNEIAEDGAELDKPNVLDEYYVGVYIDDEYAGMARFYHLGQILIEGHIFLLDRSMSKECGYEIMKWLADNVEFNRLVCKIPECFQNVCEYVESLGFAEQGFSDDSFVKNDDICGIFEYGISKSDMVKLWAL